MEPIRKTLNKLKLIEKELFSLEPIFHHPELGVSRENYSLMTTKEYWEIGASGKRYSRDYIIDTLIERYSKPIIDNWRIEDFYCQKIDTNTYLVTYDLYQGERFTRRSTIWKKYKRNWKIVFHQGTEPPRDCRRPKCLRGYGHGQRKQIFT